MTSMYKVLTEVHYKDWTLIFGNDPTRNNAPYLQWAFDALCPKTNTVSRQTSRKWYLSSFMTESELVLTAFKAALTAEEHECREHFKYKARRIFNPHISVEALIAVCHIEDVRS
jgi:hypothetical protein